MSLIDSEVGVRPPTDPVASMARPTLGRRGVGAVTEIFLYCLITIAVAIVEFYVGGFEPSNWWIGFAIYALWTLSTARRSTTPSLSVTQLGFVGDDGLPAGIVRSLGRSAIRAGVLYALPLLLFNRNQLLWIGLFVGAGLLIRSMPLGRAPWDLIAGTTMVETYGVETKVTGRALSIDDFKVDGVRKAQNQRARRMLQATGWGAIVVSLLIVWVVFSEAYQFISADEFEWGLLNGEGKRKGWFPRSGLFDIPTLLVGTLWVTGIGMLVAGPVGLGVAIYLSEYAKPRVQRIVKPVIETLASVPSVVIGMFIILVINPGLADYVFDDMNNKFSILGAGIGVGILTIPLVASISEDALRAVPYELRQAAYGLGSRKITVALRVVFPAALSGISAAFIVGISRAIGETMVVAIAAGGSGGTLFGLNPLDPGQTITGAMVSVGVGTDQVAGSGIAFQSLYFLGALLFILTLLLNVVSDAIVRRFRQAY
ncbi:MAG: phosphate ABC transporter permease subunit PstC [Actinomycetota bacterium]